MLRLPTFTYHRPKTAAEAVAIACAHGKQAMYVAGGTDLYPNMKRRHQAPSHVISLQDIPGLDQVLSATGSPRISAGWTRGSENRRTGATASGGSSSCCKTRSIFASRDGETCWPLSAVEMLA